MLVTVIAVLVVILTAGTHNVTDHASVVVALIAACGIFVALTTVLELWLFLLDVLVLGLFILLLLVVDGLQSPDDLVDLLRIAVLWQVLEQLLAEALDAVWTRAFVENLCSLLTKILVIILGVEFHCFLDANSTFVITQEILSHDVLLSHLHCDTLLLVRHFGSVHFIHALVLLVALLEQLVEVLLLGLLWVLFVMLLPLLLFLLLLLLELLLLFLLDLCAVDGILHGRDLFFLRFLRLLFGLLFFVVTVQLVFPIVFAVAHLDVLLVLNENSLIEI